MIERVNTYKATCDFCEKQEIFIHTQGSGDLTRRLEEIVPTGWETKVLPNPLDNVPLGYAACPSCKDNLESTLRLKLIAKNKIPAFYDS